MYTEIRGLLQEPPDQGLHGLSYKGEALLSSQGLTIVFLKSVCTNNFILTLYLIKMPFHTFTVDMVKVDTNFLNGFSYSALYKDSMFRLHWTNQYIFLFYF